MGVVMMLRSVVLPPWAAEPELQRMDRFYSLA
jgi:hypothetical protein